METIHSSELLKKEILSCKKEGKSIGFIPTMGALHRGHMSLLDVCKSANDVSVVSIFVNPTQFNDAEDLRRYPRNLEKDLDLLRAAACNLAFCPGEHEIYPEPDTRVFHFDGLEKVMEGKFRPGHFNGVAQVVTRLLDVVMPHRIYMGMKDFQQVAIIRKVIRDLSYPVEVVTCPTVREADGLALSSRNVLLSAEQRLMAARIPLALNEARHMAANCSPEEIKKYVKGRFNGKTGIKLEYFEIVDEKTLLPVKDFSSEKGPVGCIAVRLGNIRLIDNVHFSL